MATKPLRNSARTGSDSNVITGVGLAVRAGRAEHERRARAFILVRLVPGIDANYSREVTRVQ